MSMFAFGPTWFLLVRGRHFWEIKRGAWPEGRGSARTLVAGGLPLSDGEKFNRFTSVASFVLLYPHIFLVSLLYLSI